jgi:hypothetical protein
MGVGGSGIALSAPNEGIPRAHGKGGNGQGARPQSIIMGANRRA